MSPFRQNKLVELYNDPVINQISGFYAASADLNPRDLADLYIDLRGSAPHRHQRDKRYLEGRTGITSTGKYSNRREEHLAVALYNSFTKDNPLKLPDGGTLSILDYQTPLKARQSDKGIGKVDLFGAIDENMPCIIELKVPTSEGRCSDTPLRAFLEALAYCAIVESNLTDIASEVRDKYDIRLTDGCPALCLMAPEDYWLAYLKHKKTGDWWPRLDAISTELRSLLGLETHFIALKDAGFEMGLDGNPPQLTGACVPVTVESLAMNLNTTGSDSSP